MNPPAEASSLLPTLRAGAARLGLHLTPEQLGLFLLYRDILLDWNQRTNLTAVTGPSQVERLLFLDSLTIVSALPARPSTEGLRLLDVGSGSGIPGLPLKIVLPHLSVTLLEATGKKARFLEHVAERLALTGVNVLNARAEDLARQPDHRERYDIVVARALAPMPALAELCLPFAHAGGIVIAPKGAGAAQEVEEARRAVSLLGGRVREVRKVDMPELPPDRWLAVLEKVTPTPPAYPRRAGLPAKRPLL